MPKLTLGIVIVVLATALSASAYAEPHGGRGGGGSGGAVVVVPKLVVGRVAAAHLNSALDQRYPVRLCELVPGTISHARRLTIAAIWPRVTP
jgi:hypothetical protein